MLSEQTIFIGQKCFPAFPNILFITFRRAISFSLVRLCKSVLFFRFSSTPALFNAHAQKQAQEQEFLIHYENGLALALMLASTLCS